MLIAAVSWGWLRFLFMTQISGAWICLAYLLGLLVTGIPGKVHGIAIGSVLLLLIGIGAGWIVPRWKRPAPKLKVWLIAALVGFTAGLYFDWRMPEAAATDISRYGSIDSAVTVTGKISSTPRLNRSDKIQFELEVSDLTPAPQTQSRLDNQLVTGKIYVTIPHDRNPSIYPDRLYPGQTVAVTGSLYLPKPAGNPGGFNFAQYLRRNGIFTGLRGETINITGQASPSIFWSIRRRIVSMQTAGAGERTGALLSAIVIGRRGVDVAFEIQDAFSQAGLAHVLAASGFQVTLLISVIVSLTARLQPWTKFAIGLATLIFYVGLTGAEAPAVRAGIMGGVVLLAMATDRKVKILPVLLFAATVMLLFDPLSIWDLGFQMSFLATLGLITTVPVLDKWLDWLPPRLAGWITVPTAAYLWLLPLQLGAFGVVSPYSIPINIISSPIVSLVSVGGMVSAVVGLLVPIAGSGLAWLLSFPTEWLILLAEKGVQLPGSSYAAGTINALQILLLYGLFLLVWWSPPWRQNWWLAVVLGVLLVAVPIGYASTQLRLTVLQSNTPILLVQNQGQTGLLNLGRQKDAQFTVLPLLQRQGINHLDWAIDLNLTQGSIAAWKFLLEQLPVSMFFSRVAKADTIAPYQDLNRAVRAKQGQAIALAVGQPLDLGAVQLKLLSLRPIALQMQVQHKTWLLLQGLTPQSETLTALIPTLRKADVLWWSGNCTEPRLLQQVHPKTVIVSGEASLLQDILNTEQISTYVTEQDGAIQWTGKSPFPLWHQPEFRRFAGDAVQ